MADSYRDWCKRIILGFGSLFFIIPSFGWVWRFIILCFCVLINQLYHIKYSLLLIQHCSSPNYNQAFSSICYHFSLPQSWVAVAQAVDWLLTVHTQSLGKTLNPMAGEVVCGSFCHCWAYEKHYKMLSVQDEYILNFSPIMSNDMIYLRTLHQIQLIPHR